MLAWEVRTEGCKGERMWYRKRKTGILFSVVKRRGGCGGMVK
jgi:hypothetical protein